MWTFYKFSPRAGMGGGGAMYILNSAVIVLFVFLPFLLDVLFVFLPCLLDCCMLPLQ